MIDNQVKKKGKTHEIIMFIQLLDMNALHYTKVLYIPNTIIINIRVFLSF